MQLDALTQWVVGDLIGICEDVRQKRSMKRSNQIDDEETAATTFGCFGKHRRRKQWKMEKTKRLDSWILSFASTTAAMATVISGLLPTIAIAVLSQLPKAY